MSSAATLGARRRLLRPGRAGALAVALAAIAGLLGLGLAFALQSRSPPAARVSALHGQATWAAGVRPAPPITTLRDQGGALFSLASLRGRTVALAFFDSHCHQACPLEGRALAAAERALARARRPVLVVVSVNPLDTASSTRAAVREWGLAGAAQWHWLRGTHGALARVWRAYRIFVAPPAGGDIIHTEALYLIDRRGYERSGYVYPFAPAFVRADLATLAGGRA